MEYVEIAGTWWAEPTLPAKIVAEVSEEDFGDQMVITIDNFEVDGGKAERTDITLDRGGQMKLLMFLAAQLNVTVTPNN